jgi:hypothetical protein
LEIYNKTTIKLKTKKKKKISTQVENKALLVLVYILTMDILNQVDIFTPMYRKKNYFSLDNIEKLFHLKSRSINFKTLRP